MQTYYFDMRDGIPARDRVGKDFPTASLAIEHSKAMAQRLSEERPRRDCDLAIIVLNEDGSEIHRERVFPIAD